MSAAAYGPSWSLEDALRRQAGVIRPVDVRAWLTHSDVRREVAAGRWRRPHRGANVANNTALTDEQERWVCLLAGPQGAALAGLTAAELGSLEGYSVPEVHLTVPVRSRKPRRGGLVVHYSSHLGARGRPPSQGATAHAHGAEPGRCRQLGGP